MLRQPQNGSKLILTLFTLLLYNCGGSSSSSTPTEEDLVAESGLAAMGVIESLSTVNADIVASIGTGNAQKPTPAVSTDGENCAYELTGVTSLDLAQSGLAGTFGPTTDSISITTNDYCSKGGDWTGFSINRKAITGIECSNSGGLLEMDQGGGIFRVNDGSTEFYGSFHLVNVGRAAGYTYVCHFVFRDGSGEDDATCTILELANQPINIILPESCEIAGVTDKEIETTNPQENLYLFPTAQAGPATFGGRFSADFACRMTEAASYSDLHCLHGSRALLTVDSSDEIRDMPSLYGVETDLPVIDAVNNHTLASNWADLLDGTIENGLTVAWWSGSTAEGASGTETTCDSWQEESWFQPNTGKASQTNSTWIADDMSLSCEGEAHIMCVCY